MIEFLLKRKLSPSCCTKRLFLAITTEIPTKKLTKIGKKTTKIGLAYVNIIKQNYIEVERGVEYTKYQRGVAILTDF